MKKHDTQSLSNADHSFLCLGNLESSAGLTLDLCASGTWAQDIQFILLR